MDTSSFLDSVKTWALHKDDIRALILVGSHARGCARDDSDIDLVILTNARELYLASPFYEEFGPVKEVNTEDWGRVISIRVWYSDSGLEAEFGLTDPGWLSLPLDPGTADVLADGHRVMVDKDGAFSRFLML